MSPAATWSLLIVVWIGLLLFLVAAIRFFTKDDR